MIQRRLADLAHSPGQPRPVVVAHPARAHVRQLDLRLGRQQPHHDLGLAHLQREDDAGQSVLDRARPQEVQGERRVVRRHHAAPGQIQVRGIVDLDAADRHGADATHGVDLQYRRHQGGNSAAFIEPPQRARRGNGVQAATQFGGGPASVAGRPLMLRVGDNYVSRRRTRPRSTAGPASRRSPPSPVSVARRRREANHPTATSPIVVQPVGVGSGVSNDRAFPTPGLAATMIIWPGCRPLVTSSSSTKPVGTPRAIPPCDAIASISSIVGCSRSSSGRSPPTSACR